MPRASRRGEEGSALLVVIVATSLVATLGLMLSLTTIVETDISGNAHEAAYVLALADAAGERAMADLGQLASWDAALTGTATSGFFDGASGVRFVAGRPVHLTDETNRVTCGLPSCAGHPPDAVTADRPWGQNNPRWTVFASGHAQDVLGVQPGLLPGYAVVWVGDDPAENDGDAFGDGGPPLAVSGASVNPGVDVVLLKVVAWGPRGSRRELDLSVERADRVAHTGLRMRTWRETRGAVP